MTTEKVRAEGTQPVRRRPVPATEPFRVHWVGALPLPMAGPYRPWAHLYADTDGALWWTVRLWDTDHAAPRIVTTEQLRRYARECDLPSVRRTIDRLIETARRREGR